MKRRIICLPLLVVLAAVADQQAQVQQQPNGAAEQQQRREAYDRIEAERKMRMQKMREFDTTMRPLTRPRAEVPATPTIDKETSERIRVARRVDPADYARYADFLKGDNTGIFKLFPDHDCVTKNVIRTDGDCRDFVQASSSFSFRTRAYSHPYYHDLGFNRGQIFSNAFFSHAVFVWLGDVPIEDVSPGHDGLKFLFEFRPASQPGEAKSIAAQIKAGIQNGGFSYSSHLIPAENGTYALRSVAYDVANSLPPVSEETSASELRFHTLALDKRADVTIVFRIIRRSLDGSLTIVWKEIDRKEAPKIKFKKGEKFADFKNDSEHTQH